jgi:Ca2+/Na+ antiporter
MTIFCYIDGKHSGFLSIESKYLREYLFYLFFIIVISTILLLLFNPSVSLIFANLTLVLFVLFFIRKENIHLSKTGL